MTFVVFLSVLILGIVIGLPIAWALIACGIALMLHLDYFNAQIVAQNMILGTDNFILLAIPFFILASTFMSTGGVAQRIIRFAIAVVGHFRGA